MALALVSSCRREAASESGSGRICGFFLPVLAAVFESGDDLVQVAGDLPVHLGDAGLAVRFGRGDDLQGLLPLGVMLREELRRGHEHRAGQAPLTELTPIFQQFMAAFRLLALICPRDRIG